MKTSSTHASQNSKLQSTYYKALKAKAAQKYFANKVGVYANSSNYPNTVSLPMNSVMDDVNVLVRYRDNQPSTAYAIPPKDIMPILDAWYKQGNKLICDSRCVDTNEVGNLYRIPFDAIPDSYIIEL